MRKIKEFEVSGHKFEVKELTVKAVKSLLEKMNDNFEIHDFDLLFPDCGITSSVIAESLGVSLEEIDKLELAPSEMEQIVNEVVAVNPIMARYIKRLADIGTQIQSEATST